MERNLNIRLLLLVLLLCVGIPFGLPPAPANPKGTLAFLSNRNNPDEQGRYTAIYLINADGTDERLWLEVLLLCVGIPFGFPPAPANPKGTLAFLSKP